MRSSKAKPNQWAKAGMAVAAFLALLLCIPCATAMTLTPIGKASCDTAANTCSTTASGSVAVGGTVMVIAVIGQSAPTAIIVSDNAKTANCGGAYTVQTDNITSGATATTVIAFCTVTAGTITSGATCGAGGTSQCAFAITYAGTAAPTMLAAYAVTGNAQATFFDKQGSKATGQWTSGSAVAGANSGAVAWSSEDIISVLNVPLSSSADTVGSYTGGYTAVSAFPGSSNRPGLWIAKQTIATGTAQVGFTPTSAATRAFLSQTFSFVNAGATATARPMRTFLGVGQ